MYRVTADAGQALGLMYTGFPVHAVAALVTIQADLIPAIDGLAITASHTDDTVTVGFKVQRTRTVTGLTAIFTKGGAHVCGHAVRAHLHGLKLVEVTVGTDFGPHDIALCLAFTGILLLEGMLGLACFHCVLRGDFSRFPWFILDTGFTSDKGVFRGTGLTRSGRGFSSTGLSRNGAR